MTISGSNYKPSQPAHLVERERWSLGDYVHGYVEGLVCLGCLERKTDYSNNKPHRRRGRAPQGAHARNHVDQQRKPFVNEDSTSQEDDERESADTLDDSQESDVDLSDAEEEEDAWEGVTGPRKRYVDDLV